MQLALHNIKNNVILYITSIFVNVFANDTVFTVANQKAIDHVIHDSIYIYYVMQEPIFSND